MVNIIDLIENGKLKRFFRARDKYSYEGANCHITQHASGTEPLFLEEADYLYMLNLMKDVVRRFKLNIVSFVLMLNHIHLLLRLSNSNLSTAMQVLFQTYAQYFNSKYDRKGHVFCGPFRSALCLDEIYLLAASVYIHFNPVKGNLVINSADYRWSSCALFLREGEVNSFIDYRYILNILDDNLSKARIKYKDLLDALSNKKLKDILEYPKAMENVVDILRNQLQYSNHEENRQWTREGNLLSGLYLEQKIQDLKDKSRLRKPQDIQARRFLIEQLKARGFSNKEIAERLHLTRQSIHKALK